LTTEDADHDLVGAYVLDALPPEERAAFEAHLAGCPACRAEVTELGRVVEVLPLAVEPAEPSPALRGRILEAIAQEPAEQPRLRRVPGGLAAPVRQLRLARWTLTAAAAVLILGLGLWNAHLQQQVNSQQNRLAYLQDFQSALVHRAAVHPVSGTAYAPGALAALVQPSGVSPAYLIVQGLPANPKGTIYQMWLLRGSTPYSAGVFHYSGSGPEVVRLVLPSTGYTATAATVEPGPNGSSQGPTGHQVLIGKLHA
jgi:anti-sigma factor RsiW